MNTTIKLGISACLLGEKVRYDGTHKYAGHIYAMYSDLVGFRALCPEIQCGMSVPREPMRFEKNGSVRLVTIKTRIDLTDKITAWIKKYMAQLKKENLCGFILKARSPSCGIAVRLYGKNSSPDAMTSGLFAKAVMQNFPNLPVEDEFRLEDAKVREEFLKQAVACSKQMNG